MSLHKNCGWWKNSDWIFEFSVKIYVANTTNLSCAKILLPSVMGVVLRHGYRWNCRKVRPCLEAKVPKHTEAAINRNMALRQHLIMLCFSRVTQSTRPAGQGYKTDLPTDRRQLTVSILHLQHANTILLVSPAWHMTTSAFLRILQVTKQFLDLWRRYFW